MWHGVALLLLAFDWYASAARKLLELPLTTQVRVLLDWGASVGPLTESRWTPLHVASYSGHAGVAQ